MPLPTKEAQVAYQNAWLKKRRVAWVATLGGVCRDCGSSDRVRIMFPGGRTLVPWSLGAARRAKLLEGTWLLCWKHFVAYSVSMRKPKPPRHGTENTYGKHKCRCEACRLAKRARSTPFALKPLRPFVPRKRTLRDWQLQLLATLQAQAARLERQEKAARAAVHGILAERRSLREVTKSPMPTAFDLVRDLDDSPATGDPIWNDLTWPLYEALVAAGPKGMTTSAANAIAKDAGIPYGMCPDAIAWLHLEGLAAWHRRRWFDVDAVHMATDAYDATDAPGKKWKRRGKKPKADDATDLELEDDDTDSATFAV